MTLTSAACPLTDVIEDQAAHALEGLVAASGSTGSGCRRGAPTRSPTTAASSCGPSASTSDVPRPGRDLEVAPARLDRWLAGFHERHGRVRSRGTAASWSRRRAPTVPRRSSTTSRSTRSASCSSGEAGMPWVWPATAGSSRRRSAPGTSSPARRPAAGRSSASPGAGATRPTRWSTPWRDTRCGSCWAATSLRHRPLRTGRRVSCRRRPRPGGPGAGRLPAAGAGRPAEARALRPPRPEAGRPRPRAGARPRGPHPPHRAAHLTSTLFGWRYIRAP